MKLQRSLWASLLAVPLSFILPSAQATPVTGQANIAGTVSINAHDIFFAQHFTTTPGTAETGDFAGLTGGVINQMLNGPHFGSFYYPEFIRFKDGLSTPINFDLTYIAHGVGTLAGCSSTIPGALCTPQDSPFTFIQLTSNTVIASLQFDGQAYTGTRDSGSSYTSSIFSTQTALDGTLPEIMSKLNAGETIEGITYSASFNTSPAPEPASLFLMGIGLWGASMFRRSKAGRS